MSKMEKIFQKRGTINKISLKKGDFENANRDHDSDEAGGGSIKEGGGLSRSSSAVNALVAINFLKNQFGVGDKTETPMDLQMLYEEFETTRSHYKKVTTNGKTFMKHSAAMAQDETQLSDILLSFSSLISEKTGEKDGIANAFKKYGECLKSLAVLRSQMHSKIEVDFMQSVAELIEETKAGKTARKHFDRSRMEYDAINSKLKSTKPKNEVDAAKLKKLESEVESYKSVLDGALEDAKEELTYQLKKRDVEYCECIRGLLYSYLCYFETGLMVLKKLEAMLTKPKEKAKVTRNEKKERLPIAATRVFGVGLKEYSNREGATGPIPKSIETLIDILSRPEALKLEGIFRIPGNMQIITQYKKMMNLGQIPPFIGENGQITDSHFHIAGALLKMYVRELPEPLLTHEHYDHLIKIGGMEDEEKVVAEFRDFVRNSLPPENRYCLVKLMKLMHKVTLNSESNKMSPQALGVVFGINMMRPKESDDPMKMAQDSLAINKVGTAMIQHYTKIFADIEDEAPPPPSASTATSSHSRPSTPTRHSNAPAQHGKSSAQRPASVVVPSRSPVLAASSGPSTPISATSKSTVTFSLSSASASASAPAPVTTPVTTNTRQPPPHPSQLMADMGSSEASKSRASIAGFSSAQMTTAATPTTPTTPIPATTTPATAAATTNDALATGNQHPTQQQQQQQQQQPSLQSQAPPQPLRDDFDDLFADDDKQFADFSADFGGAFGNLDDLSPSQQQQQPQPQQAPRANGAPLPLSVSLQQQQQQQISSFVLDSFDPTPQDLAMMINSAPPACNSYATTGSSGPSVQQQHQPQSANATTNSRVSILLSPQNNNINNNNNNRNNNRFSTMFSLLQLQQRQQHQQPSSFSSSPPASSSSVNVPQLSLRMSSSPSSMSSSPSARLASNRGSSIWAKKDLEDIEAFFKDT